MKRFIRALIVFFRRLPEVWRYAWQENCLHDWKDIRAVYFSTFMGRTLIRTWTPMQVCKKCGIVRADALYLGEDVDVNKVVWVTLTPGESQVVREVIEDKGDYYELPQEFSLTPYVEKPPFEDIPQDLTQQDD